VASNIKRSDALRNSSPSRILPHSDGQMTQVIVMCNHGLFWVAPLDSARNSRRTLNLLCDMPHISLVLILSLISHPPPFQALRPIRNLWWETCFLKR